MDTCTIRCTPACAAAVEQDRAVRDGGLVVDRAVGEADPVGVVEGVHPAQRPGQARRVGEVQGRDGQRRPGRGALRVTGEGPDLVAGRPQVPGDGGARVAESLR